MPFNGVHKVQVLVVHFSSANSTNHMHLVCLQQCWVAERVWVMDAVPFPEHVQYGVGPAADFQFLE